MKCPKHFNEYRNYLVVHIISGVLLDIHIGAIWKFTAWLPFTAMCSNGFLADYAIYLFQIFIVFLVFTGVSAISLFIYRMKAATQYVENAPLQKIVIAFRHLFHFSSCLVFVFVILIYDDIKYQKEYKMKMEQKLGRLPGFMWCDSCFFMVLDSPRFIVFFILGYTTVIFGFVSGGLAAMETIRSLNSKSLRLSAKTVAIQKNFIFGLIAAVIVHIAFIFVPLAVCFWAHFTTISVPYLASFLIIMLQDHGSVSTLTMIITNNLLRRATKKIFSIPKNLNPEIRSTIFQKKNSGAYVVL